MATGSTFSYGTFWDEVFNPGVDPSLFRHAEAGRLRFFSLDRVQTNQSLFLNRSLLGTVDTLETMDRPAVKPALRARRGLRMSFRQRSPAVQVDDRSNGKGMTGH